MTDVDIDVPDLVLNVANTVVPLLVVTLLGFACVRGKVLREEHIRGLNVYVSRFGLPIMYFNAVYSRQIGSDDVKYIFVSTVAALFTLVVVAIISLINNAICKCKHIEWPEVEIIGEVPDDENDEVKNMNKKNKGKRCEKKKLSKEEKAERKEKRRRGCKKMWALKPITFTEFVSDFLVVSYANTVFVGQPLMECIMGDEPAQYYPFIGDIGYSILIFALHAAFLEYARYRREKQYKKWEEKHKDDVVVNAEISIERSSLVQRESFMLNNIHKNLNNEIMGDRRSSIYTDMASFVTGHDYYTENNELKRKSSLICENNRSLNIYTGQGNSSTSDSEREFVNNLKLVEAHGKDNSNNNHTKSESNSLDKSGSKLSNVSSEKTAEGYKNLKYKDDTSCSTYSSSCSGDMNKEIVEKDDDKRNKKKKRCARKECKCCTKMKSTIPGRVFLKVVTLPLIHGTLFGIIISFIPFTVPEMFQDLVSTVANSCTGVAVFAIGMFVATSTKQLKDIRWIYHVIMKQIIYPLIVIAVLKMMNVDNYRARASMICQTASSAVLVFSLLFEYGGYYNKTPGAILFGLIFLFPQEIAFQVMSSRIFPVDFSQEGEEAVTA